MDYLETDPEAIGGAENNPAAETGLSDTEIGPEEPYTAEPPIRAGKYRAFSALFFAFTLIGLFLGLIGNAVSWLKPSYYFGNSGLNHSLLGFFFTRMKELFSNIKVIFTGTPGVVFQHVLALLAACVLLATVIVSLICLIVSCVSAKRAKKATTIGGTISLLSYTLFLVWAYCVNGLVMSSFDAKAIDVPVAITTLLLFIVMTVYAIVENGKKGVFGAGVYLFALAICFALFFPGSFPESHFRLLEQFSANPVYNSFSLLTVLVILAGLVIAVIGLPGRSRGIVRMIVFTVEFIAVLFLAIASCGLDNKWTLQFFEESAFLPSIILIVSSLGAMLLSIFGFVLGRGAEADYDEMEEESPLDGEYTSLYTGPDAVNGLGEEDVAEMSAFEREMLSFAEKGEEASAPVVETPDIPPQPYQYAPPAFRPVNVYTDPSMQYVYDPFINELTPEEKNEFGDLFIACKSGKYGDLPIYKIGGDNAEFFDKVWIRYGLYDMSQNLRDKLFSYLRRYRNRQQ